MVEGKFQIERQTLDFGAPAQYRKLEEHLYRTGPRICTVCLHRRLTRMGRTDGEGLGKLIHAACRAVPSEWHLVWFPLIGVLAWLNP